MTTASDQQPAAAAAPAAPRAFSLRAVVVGTLLTAVWAVLTPVNDWMVGNTYLYCHYLPPGVVMVLAVLALVVNPLLGARRLRAGEMVVIVGMLLALGGVASNGFTRLWTQMVTRPARHMTSRSDVPTLVPKDEPMRLPQGFFIGIPTDRPVDANDPEHRLVVDGFYEQLTSTGRIEHRARVTWRDAAGVERTQQALGGAVARAAPPGSFLDLDAEPGRSMVSHKAGETVDTPIGAVSVLAVEPPGIPWHAWWPVFLKWLPLLVGLLVCGLSIAALVRDQWGEHERLPYPIAEFFHGFIADPAPGRRLPPMLAARGFWVGVAVAGVVLGSQGLAYFHLLPVAIATSIDLRSVCRTPFTEHMFAWYMIFNLEIYLSIVALTFFLPLNLSFSLWFFYVAIQYGWAFAQTAGVPLEFEDAARAGVGGYAVECLLILWIGRKHYGSLVKAACVGTRDERLRPVVPYVWALLLGVLCIALTLVAAGARLDQAVLAVLVLLGVMLVLARIVAEAGIPFAQTPTGWFISQTLFSLTGFGAPLAALAPLTLVGIGLFADSRENILPYAVMTDRLASRVGGVPRRRLSLAMLTTGVAGAAMCVAVMVWMYYRHDHVDDSWPYSTLMDNNLLPLEQGVSRHGGAIPPTAPDSSRTWACYAFGAALVGLVGVGRLLFAWWPLHPLGLLVMPAWATHHIWFSFFLGWAAKLLVMRYGGVGIYQRLKPFATGLIAGEAGVTVVFLIIGLTRHLLHLPRLTDMPRFLPG